MCTCEPQAYLCIVPSASVVISGQKAEACLLVKLVKENRFLQMGLVVNFQVG